MSYNLKRVAREAPIDILNKKTNGKHLQMLTYWAQLIYSLNVKEVESYTTGNIDPNQKGKLKDLIILG